MYVHSQRFVPKGSQGDSVKRLNRLRNEYIHFTPRVWVLELAGLPKIAEDSLEPRGLRQKLSSAARVARLLSRICY
jgi:hypothetical protein